MKKAILFIWFGDEKPSYIQWTLDNFRKMNPGWEIRYIEYSNAQLRDYKNQGDSVLAATTPHKCFSYWVDGYKSKYLEMHDQEFVVYCDLDCFPIAPFDNFICSPDKEFPEHIYQVFCPNIYKQIVLGTGANTFKNGTMFKSDMWCIGNNKLIMFDRFLQLHKGSVMDETLIIHNSMLMNESKLPEFKKRSKDFHEMKLELGDNFCLTRFTPVEHYYSRERNKLNKE